MNIDDLLIKASKNQISELELAQVSQELTNGDQDPYDLLLIIGRANAIQYRTLIEKYLTYPSDPMLSRLALQILCRYWNLGADYINHLQKFIKGVEWDDEDEVKDMALSCSGEVFKKNKDPILVKYVYDVFVNEDEDSISRIAAYEALAVLAGQDLSSLTQPRYFRFEKDVDLEVIKYAEMIINDVPLK